MRERGINLDNGCFAGVSGLALYLGIGALLHAIFVGAQFDWSSAWTWGWLLGWPVMFLMALSTFLLIMFALVMVAVILMAIGDAVSNLRPKQRRRRA